MPVCRTDTQGKPKQLPGRPGGCFVLMAEDIFLYFITFRFQMNGQFRKNITIGSLVKIVLKKDQASGKLTEGVVKRILTSSPNHPHGIKVMLDTGEVGRVKEIVEEGL
jgi:uncharacterized repeat protein (TIGR03833 family)